MLQLIKNDEIILGQNVRLLREHVNLLQKQLAKAIGVTVPTIRKIERGDGSSSHNIFAISHFFAIPLADLLSPDISFPDETKLRQQILAYHTKHGSTSANILNDPPTTKFLIEVRLLQQGYFEQKRTVEEIKAKLIADYNKKFKNSSSISQALAEAVKAGLLQKEPKDKRSFYYFALPIKEKKKR